MEKRPETRHFIVRNTGELVLGMKTRLAWIVGGLLLTGCPGRDIGGGAGSPDDGSGTSGATVSTTSLSGDPQTSSDPDDSSDSGMPAECDNPGGYPWGEDPVMVPGCEAELDNCRLDQDHDGQSFECDNDPDHHNPRQFDADEDGIGNTADLCPVVAGDIDHIADSDRDGIGNGCDNCRQNLSAYNQVLEAAGVPFALQIRNIPHQLDTDQDGIGDACDNCPTVANCGDFGPDNPATVGAAVPFDDPTVCQTDTDANGIGDACEGMAGMGFADGDDFDQDGLSNAEDPCPRFGAQTPDTDGDGVGDVCDTCPYTANPMQITADGAAIDDEDRDFVGASCETHPDCEVRDDPLPIGFFDISVNGLCCVTTYPGDGQWRDPDGVPIVLECEPEAEAAGMCRSLPAAAVAAPGVVTMPAGCEALLGPSCEAHEITLDDVGGDLNELWAYACRLPQWDQDFDGIGDSCDLCRHAFDPINEAYIDANGMTWPNDGRYCNGEYGPDNLDPANGCVP